MTATPADEVPRELFAGGWEPRAVHPWEAAYYGSVANLKAATAEGMAASATAVAVDTLEREWLD